MTKPYDLSKKSDIAKMSKDIENGLKEVAKEAIVSDGVETECVHCGELITVVSGKNTCKYCKNIIDVNFDFSEL